MTEAEKVMFRAEFNLASDEVAAWPQQLREAAAKTGVLARPSQAAPAAASTKESAS